MNLKKAVTFSGIAALVLFVLFYISTVLCVSVGEPTILDIYACYFLPIVFVLLIIAVLIFGFFLIKYKRSG